MEDDFSKECIKRLQDEVSHFLLRSILVLNGVVIIPKEVEVYYYKEGEFEDDSVHRNALQKNNKAHFYVHRTGTEKNDPYKGGNYPGVDFVISDDEEVYHSYLIRSALVNEKLIVGPHNVLQAIKSDGHFDDYKDVEDKPVKVESNTVSCPVLFSKRINLGKKVREEFVECKLRAVLCDEWFRNSKYPSKEKMVVEYLLEEVRVQNMDKEEALAFAKEHLGYIPALLKRL